MALAHVAYVMIHSLAKPIIEVALERYTTKLVKVNGKYLVHQIDSICNVGTEVADSYAVRTRGYCTTEEAVSKLEASETDLARQIKTLAQELHKSDDEFEIIDV